MKTLAPKSETKPTEPPNTKKVTPAPTQAQLAALKAGRKKAALAKRHELLDKINDPSQAMHNPLDEKRVKLICAGMSPAEAYRANNPKPITKQSAAAGAVRFLKRADVRARLAFLSEQTYKETGTDPRAGVDLSTPSGRKKALEKLVIDWGKGEGRGELAIKALEKIMEMEGDFQAAAAKRETVDPADVMAYLVQVEMEGKTIIEAVEGAGHDLAWAVCRAIPGCESVRMVINGQIYDTGPAVASDRTHAPQNPQTPENPRDEPIKPMVSAVGDNPTPEKPSIS